MSKVRVYEVAKQLNLDPKAVVALFHAVGVSDVRNHMSSVEAEAVDRVRRHLEKQRTHDVVEEKIRPTVVKRRAVAKPVPSSPLSSPAPSSSLASSLPSSVPLSVPPSMGSSPSLSSPLAPPSAAASVRLPDPEPSAPSLPHEIFATDAPVSVQEERRSVRNLAQLAQEASLPSERPSVRELEAAPPSRAVEFPPLSRIPETVQSPLPLESAPPPSVHAVSSHPVAVAEAPSVRPLAIEEHIAESPLPVAADVAARPNVPKTGVEYWGGRPGVPMPQPSANRGVNGPNMPRRVQYDPRGASLGGAQPGGGVGVRPTMRPAGPQGRGFMRPGGAFSRGRNAGPVSTRKPVSTAVEMSAHKKVIRIEENITLSQMAQKLSLKSTELLMKLLSMGMTGVHINTSLDADTAKILASEFGWEVEDLAQSEDQHIAAARGEQKVVTEAEAEDLVPRSPVVTVMGHVDHGKTSLLDKIRKANVAGGEAGGITQHIGAYKVSTGHGLVVFLDTPGHEAFTQMRARGASVTDIVILVVAADDGVMPQTKEAVAHAKSANVSIIVAVNKIDKPGAEPERVKRELSELGLQAEEWGGDTMFLHVSALTGEGIPALLDALGLQSEMLQLTANPKAAASGTVLEALLDRGRGPVARVLIQDGTLRVGDLVLAGAGFGKVRAMTNEHGKQVHEAGPATPVEILGLSDVPNAGDQVHVVKDPKKAQEIAEQRKGKMAKSLVPATAKVSLEELSKRISESGQQELRVIIKGDVQGSVEALAEALSKLTCDKARLSIIHAGVGAITEGDVNLAVASRAIIIGFNQRPAGKASSLAEENKIEIRTYSIIYNAVDDVRGAMEGLLPPTLQEKVLGHAEVRQLFKVKGQGIAGAFVLDGLMRRGCKARLLRDGEMLWEGKMAALRRFKDDAKEVLEGFECGISLDGYGDLKEKDVIEAFEIEEIKQKL